MRRAIEVGSVVGMLMWLASAAQARPARGTAAADAVVKVFTTAMVPRGAEPWAPGSSQSSQGSGAVLQDGRILTAAHVVARATMIRVQAHGGADKTPARVQFISHDADLALLVVDEPRFLDGVSRLSLGELPAAQEEVVVLGFPVGGDALSVTKGVISRVEHTDGPHSGANLLALQIDAAVNPGNSGGPVVAKDLIVGIATASLANEQNVNYATPAPVVRHFIDDIADGRYDGFPRLGIKTQNLESPSLRHWLGVPDGRTGVRVTSVAPASPASRALQADDVLLAVNGHAIADDGTVEFRPRERTRFTLYVDEQQVGGRVSLLVWRDRAEREVGIPLDWAWPCGELVRSPEFEQAPRFFVFGGLAFQPLDWNYLVAIPGWPTGSPALVDEWAAKPDDEPVILNKVFASAANDGYEDLSRRLIVAVDGVPPRNLADLVRLVESGSGEFVRFTDIEGQEIVLDRRLATNEGPEILSRYQLAADRSAELSPRDYLSGRAATVPSYADAARPTSSMPPATAVAGDVGGERGARTNSLPSTP